MAIKTGEQYRASLRDGREVRVDGERADDPVNSGYAGRRATFEIFAQSPPFAHANAVYVRFNPSSVLEQ